MKKAFLAVLTLTLMATVAQAQSLSDVNKSYGPEGSNQALIEQQATFIYNFYTAVLPAKVLDRNQSMVHMGQADNGQPCSIYSNGATLIMDSHPDMSNTESDTTTYTFAWNPNEIDANILGIQVKPEFQASNDEIQASARIPTGMTVVKFGLKIKVDRSRGITEVNIRNQDSLFGKTLSCYFKK